MARQLSGAEITRALQIMIETGELELPPEGAATLSIEEVAAELGIDLNG